MSGFGGQVRQGVACHLGGVRAVRDSGGGCQESERRTLEIPTAAAAEAAGADGWRCRREGHAEHRQKETAMGLG